MEIKAHLDTCIGHDGLALTLERFDAPSSSNPTLIYTHGFGQNRLAWRTTAARLAGLGWPGIALDGRGHGDSAWSRDGAYELDDFVWDLMRLAQAQASKPILIGASMGGLLALLSEAEAGAAGLFRAIILVDVTPRWESEGVGRIFEFMSAHPHGFATLEEAAAAVSRYLPHRDQKDPNRLRGHLREGADGRLRWHWDPRLLEHIPRASERYIPRLEAAASLVRCPVLLLSGGRSDVVSASTIASFQALVPHAQHRQIAEATHMVVGDRNDQFTAEIERYLSSEVFHSNAAIRPELGHITFPNTSKQ
jgi:pimeloyl-ACP methyl ester carboxylesterase